MTSLSTRTHQTYPKKTRVLVPQNGLSDESDLHRLFVLGPAVGKGLDTVNDIIFFVMM